MTIILLFIFGAAIGSFLNVVILRLPKEQPLTGRSRCNFCGHILSAAELVPLFSYLILGGKCKYCQKSFSARYFIIEAVTGLLFVFAWWQLRPFDLPTYLFFIKALFLICAFLVIFAIDFEHYLILDQVVFFGLGGALLLGVLSDIALGQKASVLFSHLGLSLLWALVAAAPFFLAWYLSAGRWMGFGDVKLALLLGAAFGWPLVGISLMLAVFLGGGTAIFLLLWGSKNLKSQIPFGTFLSLAAVLTLFYGPAWLLWYLGILGF